MNNKLGQAITAWENHELRVGTDKFDRTIKDLEVTKLRAVDQFPEVLDPPYGETFRQLSCIDNELDQAALLSRLKRDGLLSLSLTASGLRRTILVILQHAKACKDTLEVDLMHSFDLKPSEQNTNGVTPTTPNGTDTQNPNKLNAPKSLQHAYKCEGFVGEHERDYLATGVNGSDPESWPQGRNVLFFSVFDLFGSTRGAQKAEGASEQNLKSVGFVQIPDSSLGSGEVVFQKLSPPLLSTIIYVQRGTFIMKIAGACRGCGQGSIEGSLERFAQEQHGQAIANGFRTGTSSPGGGRGCSGSAPVNQNQIKAPKCSFSGKDRMAGSRR